MSGRQLADALQRIADAGFSSRLPHVNLSVRRDVLLPLGTCRNGAARKRDESGATGATMAEVRGRAIAGVSAADTAQAQALPSSQGDSGSPARSVRPFEGESLGVGDRHSRGHRHRGGELREQPESEPRTVAACLGDFINTAVITQCDSDAFKFAYADTERSAVAHL